MVLTSKERINTSMERRKREVGIKSRKGKAPKSRMFATFSSGEGKLIAECV